MLKRPLFLSVIASAALFSGSAQSAPLSHLQTFDDDFNGHDYFSFTNDSVSTADNRFVYAIAGVDDAINILERAPNSKQLTLIDTVLGNEDTGEGTDRPDDVLMSPDQQHLYVLGGSPEDTDDSIFVFERNPDTGALTEVQEYSARGLDYPARFTMSEDGQFLYVASLNSHSVTVLQRAANGTLSEIQFLTDVEAEFTSGYDYPTAVVISPDQNHLYVGLWVSSNSNGVIAHYQRDPSTGVLTYVDQNDFTQNGLAGLQRPTGLAISPDGQHLYATCMSHPEIFEFQINASSGSLTFSGTANVDTPDAKMSKLIWANNIQLSNNGHLAYVTDTILDALVLFHRDIDSGELTYASAETHDDNNVIALRQNERVTLSPDSRFAYVGGAGGFAVFDLTLDLELSTQTSVLSDGTTTVESTIFNQGPVAAHHIRLQFQVEDGVLIEAADPFSLSTQCSITDNLATCDLDTLNANASEIVTFTISASNEGSYAVISSVTSDEIDDQTDNNSVQDTINFGSVENEDDRGSDNNENNANNDSNDDSSGGSGGGSLNLTWCLLLAGLGWLRRRK